jgi:hypothetical protein
MVKHKHQIHSKYMLIGLEVAMLTLQADHKWILQLQLLHQTKFILWDKEFRIFFKKKFKFQIIFSFQIILINVVQMDAAINIDHVHAVLVPIHQPVK